MSFSGRLMTVRQFSSTADVTQTYAPLSLLSTVSSSSSAFFSCPLYFPSLRLLIPFPPSCLLFTLSALSVGIFLSLSPLSPSLFLFFLFFYIALSTSLFFPFFLLLSILSAEMSGWSEALCPGDCCAIRFSDGFRPRVRAASVCGVCLCVHTCVCTCYPTNI